MLQFIQKGISLSKRLQRFQYISCCSLSKQGEGKQTSGRRISIHLMLQFICKEEVKAMVIGTISIHLMLQFITNARYALCVKYGFQYISCCSLSIVVHGLNGCPKNFNTSHVVVYRNNAGYDKIAYIFQYISCCSLSNLQKK